VRVSEFIIVFGIVTSAERAAYLQQNGQSITSVRFDDDDVGSKTWKAQAVRDVCAFCRNVTHIDVPTEVPIIAYKRLAQALPALSSVRFKKDACSDAAFTAVVQSCRHLTSIALSESACNWHQLLSMVPTSLLHIRLSDTTTTTQIIDSVNARCPLLRTLIMADESIHWCMDELLQRIATRCPFLESVRISNGLLLRGAGIRALGQAGRLRILQVNITQRGMVMNAAYFAAISEILPLNPNLHTLATPASTACLEVIADHAKQLQHLSLCSGAFNSPVFVSQGLLFVARSCTQLRTLHLKFYVTNHILIALGARCPHLTALAAAFGRAISDVGVRALAQGCPQLREVSAMSHEYFKYPVSMVGVTALATHCPHLRELDVCWSVAQTSLSATVIVVGRILVTVHEY
jgi:hypothetical protein